MPYPGKSGLSRPCPSCGGILSRRTDDPKRPLGTVACLGCPFTSPIADFAGGVQAAIMAKAQERLDKEKKK